LKKYKTKAKGADETAHSTRRFKRSIARVTSTLPRILMSAVERHLAHRVVLERANTEICRASEQFSL
jgi:hypothetical protein